MPCVSIRGTTKDKLQDYCKKNNVSMSSTIEKLLASDPKFKNFKMQGKK